MVGNADVIELATCFVSSDDFPQSPVHAGISRAEDTDLTTLRSNPA